MDADNLDYFKNIIFQKRKDILETDNFTNWFGDNNNGNPNKGGELRDNSHCINGENRCSYNENDIHSKAEILQYLLDLDYALFLIRKGNYGTCINCNEEIPINHLEKIPNTQHCPGCE